MKWRMPWRERSGLSLCVRLALRKAPVPAFPAWSPLLMLGEAPHQVAGSADEPLPLARTKGQRCLRGPLPLAIPISSPCFWFANCADCAAIDGFSRGCWPAAAAGLYGIIAETRRVRCDLVHGGILLPA